MMICTKCNRTMSDDQLPAYDDRFCHLCVIEKAEQMGHEFMDEFPDEIMKEARDELASMQRTQMGVRVLDQETRDAIDELTRRIDELGTQIIDTARTDYVNDTLRTIREQIDAVKQDSLTHAEVATSGDMDAGFLRHWEFMSVEELSGMNAHSAALIDHANALQIFCETARGLIQTLNNFTK